jgi:hypothetical protein
MNPQKLVSMIGNNLLKWRTMDIPHTLADDGAWGDVTVYGHANHVPTIIFIRVHGTE